jgi:hypothetical protein
VKSRYPEWLTVKHLKKPDGTSFEPYQEIDKNINNKTE